MSDLYKLLDVCDFQGGTQPPKDEWRKEPSEGYVRMLQIRDYSQDSEKYAEYVKDTKKLHKCKKEDIMLSRYGYIGQAFIGLEGAYNVALVKVIKLRDIETKYLLYYFKSKSFQHYLLENVGARATIPGFNKSELKDATIKIPSANEQLCIAGILGKIESIIEARQQELQKLDELVKARFVEMFGEQYPEDTLLNLCNIIDYRGKTPEKVDSGLPFITAKNVKMHYMAMEPREYISKDTYDKVMVRGFPKEGDVVFTTEAPLGNVCRIPHFDTEFYIGQRIVTMQTEVLNPIYLEYALSDNSFVEKYMSKSSGSTVTGIRVRLLEQLTIPVPPRALQDDFACFVKQLDKSKVAAQKALNEAQLLFDSLMQKYFG